MSVQPSLNNSNMVVAEIINEINSTQPSGNYSQNTRATPIQKQQIPTQNAQQQQPQPQMPTQNAQQPQPQMPTQNTQQPQRRATPFRRLQQQPQQPQNTQKVMQKPPVRRRSFLQKQKEKMRNKKVRFKEEVEEHIIQERDSESESESEDTTPIEDVIEKKEITKSKKTSKTKPKFLKKDDVQKNDLNETKGFYSKAIHFFTNDTKEPLLVLALVFAISMPVVNKLMERFLPFLMKYGEGSLFVVGVKALVVALVFFAIKKLLL
jgi:hypothetical protein